jgi:hypothetical protein
MSSLPLCFCSLAASQAFPVKQAEMAGTLMPEQIAQQLAGLHLGAPHQQVCFLA